MRTLQRRFVVVDFCSPILEPPVSNFLLAVFVVALSFGYRTGFCIEAVLALDLVHKPLCTLKSRRVKRLEKKHASEFGVFVASSFCIPPFHTSRLFTLVGLLYLIRVEFVDKATRKHGLPLYEDNAIPGETLSQLRISVTILRLLRSKKEARLEGQPQNEVQSKEQTISIHMVRIGIL
ncbi:hypothetical protein VNO78_02254 [Psophocarpus tetragonolobus]|uniref:Uncharacterized protein n=1 Tax=Psophocarpus tetragonolobus TaxID=3891 RepID=A0AAN9XV20_PSOTE